MSVEMGVRVIGNTKQLFSMHGDIDSTKTVMTLSEITEVGVINIKDINDFSEKGAIYVTRLGEILDDYRDNEVSAHYKVVPTGLKLKYSDRPIFASFIKSKCNTWVGTIVGTAEKIFNIFKAQSKEADKFSNQYVEVFCGANETRDLIGFGLNEILANERGDIEETNETPEVKEKTVEEKQIEAINEKIAKVKKQLNAKKCSKSDRVKLQKKLDIYNKELESLTKSLEPAKQEETKEPKAEQAKAEPIETKAQQEETQTITEETNQEDKKDEHEDSKSVTLFNNEAEEVKTESTSDNEKVSTSENEPTSKAPEDKPAPVEKAEVDKFEAVRQRIMHPEAPAEPKPVKSKSEKKGIELTGLLDTSALEFFNSQEKKEEEHSKDEPKDKPKSNEIKQTEPKAKPEQPTPPTEQPTPPTETTAQAENVYAGPTAEEMRLREVVEMLTKQVEKLQAEKTEAEKDKSSKKLAIDKNIITDDKVASEIRPTLSIDEINGLEVICTDIYNRLLDVENWADNGGRGIMMYIKALLIYIEAKRAKDGGNNGVGYAYSENKKKVLINTNLLDIYGNYIYIIDHDTKTKYVYNKTLTVMKSKSSLLDEGFSIEVAKNLPETIKFAEKPSSYIFMANMNDFDLEDEEHLYHIIEERKMRFPEKFRNEHPKLICDRIKMNIEQAIKMSQIDYRFVIPMYNIVQDEIEFLIPFYLDTHIGQVPELSIIVSRKKGLWKIFTILPTEVAMENVRLVCNPNTTWMTK